MSRNALQKIIDHHYFYFSSDNCSDIESRFYGYAITNTGFYYKIMPPNLSDDAAGVFINISRNMGSISIKQDMFGSYGLFLFRRKSFWAVSNSFMLLIENIVDRFSLTINEDFVACAALPYLTPLAYLETLINEIIQLPPNVELVISTDSKKLSIVRKQFSLYSIPLDSQEAFAIIDAWHDRYNSLLLALVSACHDAPIGVELSGGMDSRCALSPLLETITHHRERIAILSSTHAQEDYNIAQKVAERSGLQLNKPQPFLTGYKLSCEDRLACFKYAKSPMHNMGYYCDQVFDNYSFTFNGLGGEALRACDNYGIDKLVEVLLSWYPSSYRKFSARLHSLLTRENKRIQKCFANEQPNLSKFFMFTRWRNHSKKCVPEYFLVNRIYISILFDPQLSRINFTLPNSTRDIMFAAIIARFSPHLFDIPFDSKRHFTPQIKQLAKKLNDKYPYKHTKNSDFGIFLSPIQFVKFAPATGNICDINSYVYDIYQSPKARLHIIETVGKEIYEAVDRQYKCTHHMYSRAWPLQTLLPLHYVKDLIQKDNTMTKIMRMRDKVSTVDASQYVVITTKKALDSAVAYFSQCSDGLIPAFVLVDCNNEDDSFLMEHVAKYTVQIYPWPQRMKPSKSRYAIFATSSENVFFQNALDRLIRLCSEKGIERRYDIILPPEVSLPVYKTNSQASALYGTRYSFADEDSKENLRRTLRFLETGDECYLKLSAYQSGRHPALKLRNGDVLLDYGVRDEEELAFWIWTVGEKGLLIKYSTDPNQKGNDWERFKDFSNVIIESTNPFLANDGEKIDLFTTQMLAYGLPNKSSILRLHISHLKQFSLKNLIYFISQYHSDISITITEHSISLLEIIMHLHEALPQYHFYFGVHGIFPPEFGIYCVAKKSSIAVADNITETLKNISLYREISKPRDDIASVITFANNFENVLNDFSTFDPKPEFIVIDWAKDQDERICALARTYKVKVFKISDVHPVAPGRRYISARASAEPWLAGYLFPLIESSRKGGLGSCFQIDPKSVECISWKRTPSPDFIEKRMADISAVYDMLEDEESRRIFLSVLKCVETGNPGYLRQSPYAQYNHPDVHAEEGDVVISGGLGTGGTTETFSGQVGDAGLVIGFEPLAKYQEWATWRVSGLANIRIIPFGLWSGKNTFYIADEGGGSHLMDGRAENAEQCAVIDLDTWMASNQHGCSLIKLDIEGAELQCLKGAMHTLAKFLPKLQICLYHSTDDYLDIPLWLKAHFPKYKFYMGHHTPWYGETVLYAVKREEGFSQIGGQIQDNPTLK